MNVMNFINENKVNMLIGVSILLLIVIFSLLANGNGNTTPPTDLNATEGEFSVSNETINKVKSILEGMIYVNSGEKYELQYLYSNYSEGFNVLTFDFMGQEQPIYLSSDEKYLLVQKPYTIDEYLVGINEAVLQMDAYLANQTVETKPIELVKTDKPVVKLYVMSDCPYGDVAENAILDALLLLNDTIDFEPVYILSGSNGNYNSLHGTYELNQDIREKIVFNKYGSSTWIKYTVDINNNCNSKNMETCWKEMAINNELDTDYIESQFNSSYNEIADLEVQKSNVAKVSSSPTLKVNGVSIDKQFIPEYYKQFICGAFSVVPGECNTTLSDVSLLDGSSGSC